jgi:hypothetical protein
MAIVEIKIDTIEPFADGLAFGDAGSYLRIKGSRRARSIRRRRKTASSPISTRRRETRTGRLSTRPTFSSCGRQSCVGRIASSSMT